MDSSAARLAADALERETTVAGLLRATCVGLTELLEAEGCSLSRLVGQLLIDLVDENRGEREFRLGRGYLLSDFPLTAEVFQTNEPRTVRVVDQDADASEVALLRELGVGSLLMLPIHVDGHAWGLAEVYGTADRVFDADDVGVAEYVLARAGACLARVHRQAAVPQLLR